MSGSGQIVDANERQRALDHRASFIVQAPAGSGKTELLTQRLLALLGVVDRPEEILAITFTRKAAGEMRNRLLQALDAADGPPPASAHGRQSWELARLALHRDRSRDWRIRDNPSQLNVQTIDGFCASLVRRMPWISRLGGLPEIADDPTPDYLEAAERTLARIDSGRRGGRAVKYLLRHLDNRLPRLRDLLVDMLRRRDQWLRHVVGNDHSRQRGNLENSLRLLVEAFLDAADRTIPPDCRDRLLSLGRFAAANLAQRGVERPLTVLAGLEYFPGPKPDELEKWWGLADLLLTASGALRKKVDVRCGFPAGKNEDDRNRKRLMEETLGLLPPDAGAAWKAVQGLPPAAYPEEQWRVLEALVELLPIAVAELWLVFREQSRVDFAEVALKALSSLGDEQGASDLLLKLDNRLSHILVDEFQDTSFLQFGLLRKLTSGWEEGDGRTLFLVGDPMQSIYRFREAEVGLFLKARQEGIGTVKLTSLVLRSNFRSQKGVVDWVNESFCRIFPSCDNVAMGAVSCAAATAVHPRLPETAVQVHAHDDRDDRDEANRVTELVRHERETRPDDTIGILVRSRTHLPQILQALRGAGIHYQAQDIDLLDNRPAARDAVSLTRALLHPGDRLAWLSVLRAPWCGLKLEDLFALCGNAAGQTLPDLLAGGDRLSALSDDGRERARRLHGVLRRGMAQRGRAGLRRLVEGCWLALGGPACCDAQEREDVERVFGLLETLDFGGDLASLSALDRGLQKLFAAADGRSDGRVQVMTIHRAKGLEFDTVILPGLGRSPARAEQPLMRWLEHPDCGLLLAPIAAAEANRGDPLYDIIGKLDREKENHEVARLIYVAATRAKRQLHLIGHAKRNAKGEPTPAPGSLLAKLWPAVAAGFRPPEEMAPVEEEPVDPQRPLRRLPSGWTLPALSEASGRTVSPAPSGDRKILGENGDAAARWEAEVYRHVGSLVHFFLERIAREGLQGWDGKRLKEEEFFIERGLSGLGVPRSRLPDMTARVLRALERTLGSEKGRWILHHHREANCELELSGTMGGEIVHKVIDRTFVDRQGDRWIIDYKTSECEGRDLEGFLREEVERYRPQLTDYAHLFQGLEPRRTIRTALYFPLLDAWREVGFFQPE